MKRRSIELTGLHGQPGWVERTAARTMLRAVRFSDEDFEKPLIAVAVPYTNGTPCNDHIRELGDQLLAALEREGGKAIIYFTASNILQIVFLKDYQLHHQYQQNHQRSYLFADT